ncbi:hypothetical protein HAX54_053024 [Datura stramonium]|uniref:Uncharacterized protein n=1 Tax=Datura stramonium TaxID=4076 RepID=A0ABS8WT36_DATST|nr:hypothetical protein [Datura stramonium]
MTCSKCHQQDHNRRAYKAGIGMSSIQPPSSDRNANSSQPPSSDKSASSSQPMNSSQPEGTSSERVVIASSNDIITTTTNTNFEFESLVLRWKGREAITTFQLQ